MILILMTLSTKRKIMTHNDDIWDFGFTAVTEDELDAVQVTHHKLKETEEGAQAIQQKLDKLYSAIQPLLHNLKANPEKEYIWWPERQQKVEEFEAYISAIYK